MENPELENKLVMPKYALYIWGIVLSPLAAGVFLALNILNLHRISRARIAEALVPFSFGLLYVLVRAWPYLFAPYWLMVEFNLKLNSIILFLAIQTAYTVFLIEWNWKKFLS